MPTKLWQMFFDVCHLLTFSNRFSTIVAHIILSLFSHDHFSTIVANQHSKTFFLWSFLLVIVFDTLSTTINLIYESPIIIFLVIVFYRSFDRHFLCIVFSQLLLVNLHQLSFYDRSQPHFVDLFKSAFIDYFRWLLSIKLSSTIFWASQLSSIVIHLDCCRPTLVDCYSMTIVVQLSSTIVWWSLSANFDRLFTVGDWLSPIVFLWPLSVNFHQLFSYNSCCTTTNNCFLVTIVDQRFYVVVWLPLSANSLTIFLWLCFANFHIIFVIVVCLLSSIVFRWLLSANFRQPLFVVLLANIRRLFSVIVVGQLLSIVVHWPLLFNFR